LAESQRIMAEELAQASHYVQSLLPKALKGAVRVDWSFVPSTQLGGDMFGFHWLDPAHLAIYLLDVSGHGVGSSLLAVSASNLLTSQALPNTDFRNPGQVMSRVNDVFQMDRQNDKYFTIWYGVYRCGDRSLAYSNAGHPPPLLWTGSSPAEAALTQLMPTDPFIGICPPGMDFETRSVKLDPYAMLLVYSDGAFEIENPAGAMWKHQEFVDFVSKLPRNGELLSEHLLRHVRQRHGSDLLGDDFSVVEVQF
jgi:sigma-B regulation protein RsbU (phosphoserine phosphatase)